MPPAAVANEFDQRTYNKLLYKKGRRRLGEIRDAFVTFQEENAMTKEIPAIARMIVLREIITEKNEKKEDNSYYNASFDSSCEYCMNTTAWD